MNRARSFVNSVMASIALALMVLAPTVSQATATAAALGAVQAAGAAGAGRAADARAAQAAVESAVNQGSVGILGATTAEMRFGQLTVEALEASKIPGFIGSNGTQIDPRYLRRVSFGDLFVVVTREGNQLEHGACHLQLVEGIVACSPTHVDPGAVTPAVRSKLKAPTLLVTGVGYNSRTEKAIIFYAIP